jgi:hypothetical protein
VPRPAPAQFGRDPVLGLVLLDERVGGCVVDGEDAVGEVAHAVAVHRDAQPDLSLDLVALGDGDVAHVVAEASDPQVLRLVPAERGPRPDADAPLDFGVVPVADHGLSPVP